MSVVSARAIRRRSRVDGDREAGRDERGESTGTTQRDRELGWAAGAGQVQIIRVRGVDLRWTFTTWGGGELVAVNRLLSAVKSSVGLVASCALCRNH